MQEREQPFRKGQILRWVYKDRAGSFADMSNLSKDLRSRLADSFSLGRNDGYGDCECDRCRSWDGKPTPDRPFAGLGDTGAKGQTENDKQKLASHWDSSYGVVGKGQAQFSRHNDAPGPSRKGDGRGFLPGHHDRRHALGVRPEDNGSTRLPACAW